MFNKYYPKTKKNLKKKPEKETKIFLKQKKRPKKARDRYKNLSGKKEEKKMSISLE